MLPRPRSVLDDPELFGRRRPEAPTGMMPTDEDNSDDPMVKYGWAFPEKRDERELEDAIDEHTSYPLMHHATDKREWRNVAHSARYTFEEQMSRLNKEDKFVTVALGLLNTQPAAATLLEEKRGGILERLSTRSVQIAEAKNALREQAAFNRDYFMDMLAIYHVLDRDIEADARIAHEEHMAALAAQGIAPGFRSLSE